MKLRLPHKFQAALMAALASVSFTTLSTGAAYGAESQTVQTITFKPTDTGEGQWGGTSASGYNLDVVSDSWSLTKVKDSKGVGTKSSSDQLRPNTNVETESGWILSFTITNSGQTDQTISAITLNSFLFNNSNDYQGNNTARKFNTTLTFGGQDYSQTDYVITSNGGANPPTGVLSYTLNAPVTIAAGGTQTFSFKMDKGSTETNGCFVGLTSIVMSYVPAIISSTWQGAEGANNWTEDAGAWSPAWAAGNNAVFGSTGYHTVAVTTAVTAEAVTVEGQNYTFNLSGSNASLTASALTVESGLSITGTGTVSAATIAAAGKTISLDSGVTLRGVATGQGTLTGAGTYVATSASNVLAGLDTDQSGWTGTINAEVVGDGTNLLDLLTNTHIHGGTVQLQSKGSAVAPSGTETSLQTNLATTGRTGNFTLANTTFTTGGALRFNDWQNNHVWTVGAGAALQVGGDLWMDHGNKLVISNNGSVTVGGKLLLGHSGGSNSTGLEMSGADASLKADWIAAYSNSNASGKHIPVSITGGTVEFTASGNALQINNSAVCDVTIGGSGNDYVTLKADGVSWSLAHAGMTVGNITAETTNSGAITLGSRGKSATYTGALNITSGSSLTLDGTIARSELGSIEVTGTLTLANSVVFDLTNFTHASATGAGTYTIFSGSGTADLSGYGFSVANITGFTGEGSATDYGWTFNADGTISYSTAVEFTWAGTQGEWMASNAWTKNGELATYVSSPNSSARFGASSEAGFVKSIAVNSAVEVHDMTVNDAYTFTLGNGGSIAASSIAVDGEGASLTVNGTGTVTTMGISASGKTITVDSGILLQGGTADAFNLDGSGTYALGSGTSALGSVTLADSWAGTLKFSNVTGFNGINLDAYGHTAAVELDNVSGYLYSPSNGSPHTFNTKMVLGTGGLTLVNGNSNYEHKFAGGVEGSGDLKVTLSDGSTTPTYHFNGSVQGWTGNFILDGSGKTVTLVFEDQATEVNAGIQRNQGTLNVNVGDGTNAYTATFHNTVGASALTVKAQANATFNEAVTLAGNINLNGSSIATFNEAVSAAALAVGDNRSTGATATFNGALTLSGSFTLNGTAADEATVALNGDTTVNGSFDLSNGQTAYGTVTLATEQTLDLKGNIWMSQNARLVLQKDATAKLGDALTVKGLEDGATITRPGSADQYNLNNSSYTLTKVEATVNNDQNDVQLRFADSKFVTSHNVTLKNLQSVFSGMDIQGGTTTVGASDAAGTVQLGAVALSGGGNLTLASGVTGTTSGVSVTGTGAISGGTLKMDASGLITLGENAALTLSGVTVDLSAKELLDGETKYVDGADSANGFACTTGKVQLVEFGNGSNLTTGTGTTYVHGINRGTLVTDEGEDQGYVTFDDTNYSAFFVNKAGTVESLSAAMEKSIGRPQGPLTAVYLKAGTLDTTGAEMLNTLHVNSGEGTVYVTGDTASIITLDGSGRLSVGAGTNLNGSYLNIAAGDRLTLEGGATITYSNISNLGTLDIGADTIVDSHTSTVTVHQGGSFTTTGEGTLKLAELANGTGNGTNQGGTVSIGSASEITYVRATGGELTFGGTGTHTVGTFRMVMNERVATHALVDANATLHITGTDVATAAGNGSFLLTHWTAKGTLDIAGTLVSEALISAWDGEAEINVKEGGKLELHKGLNRNSERTGAINVNIASGATLVAGTADGGVDDSSLHVNLNGGSTLQAYYAESQDTATIAKTLTLGEGTVTIDAGASGKALAITSGLAGNGTSITKAGEGTLELSGANTYTGATTVNAGTLKTNHLGTGDTTVNGGTLELTSAITTAGTLTLGNNTTLVFAGADMLTAGSLALGQDVTALTFNLNSIVPTGHGTITLATGTNGAADLSGVNVYVVWDTKPTYYTTDGVKQVGNSWVITLENEGRELIWNGSEGIWSSTEAMWHTATEPGLAVAFNSGDSAIFEASVDPAYAMLAEAVEAEKVTVQSGATVAIMANFGAEAVSLSATDMEVGGNLTTNVNVTAAEIVGNGTDATWIIGNGTTVTTGILTAEEGATLTFSGEGTLTAGTITGDGTIAFGSGFQPDVTAITVAEGKELALSGAVEKTVTQSNLNLEGKLVLENGYHLTISGTLPTGTASLNIRNNAKLGVSLGNTDTILNMDAASSGDLYLNSGYISYRSVLGTQTLHMANGTQLWFGEKPGSSADAAQFANDIVLDGNATVHVYGGTHHTSVTVSGDVSGAGHTLTKNDGNQNLTFTGDVTLGGLTTDSNGGGTIYFSGDSVSIDNITTNGSATVVFNGGSASIGTIVTKHGSTIQFSNKEGAESSSYSFDTFALGSNGTDTARWLVVDANVTVEGKKDTLTKGDVKATISNDWGIDGGGVKVDGVLNLAGEISMDGPESNYIKGAGIINTTGLNLCNGSTTYIQDGITVNITSSVGIHRRNNNASLHFAEATLAALNNAEGADADWTLQSGYDHVYLDDSTNGTTFKADANRTITLASAMEGSGKLVKAGEGTVVMTGANTYSGGTAINAGTLAVAGDGAIGAVTIGENGILRMDKGYNFSNTVSGAGKMTYAGEAAATLNFSDKDISEWTGSFENQSSAEVTLNITNNLGRVNASIGSASGAGAVNITSQNDVFFDNVVNVKNVSHTQSHTLFVETNTDTGKSGKLTATGTVTAGRLVVGETADSAGTEFILSGADAQLGSEHTYGNTLQGYGTFAVVGGARQTLSNLNTANKEFHGTLKADGENSVLTITSALASGVKLSATNGGEIVLTQTYTMGDNTAVDGGTVKVSNGLTVNGTVDLSKGTLTQTGGTVSVNEGKSLTLGNASITSAIANSGAVAFTQDITATGLAEASEQYSVGADDERSTNGNYFYQGKRTEGTLTVVTGGGTVTTGGIKVTQGGHVYTLKDDGTATGVTADGVDYSTFYQGQAGSTVSVSQIAATAAKHNAELVGVYSLGAYGSPTVLNVNQDVKNVMLGFATMNIDEDVNFTGDLLIFGGMNTVSGQVGTEQLGFFAAQDSVTTFTDAPIQNGGVTFTSDQGAGGVVVQANKVADDDENYYYYAINDGHYAVIASELSKEGEGSANVANSLQVQRVHNSKASSTGKLTLSAGAFNMSLNEVIATSGDVEFLNMAAANATTEGKQTSVSLNKLEIGAGKTVSFYEATAPTSVEDMVRECAVTVTGTLTAGEGATLNAGLNMVSGSHLDVSGAQGSMGLIMGSPVTLNSGMYLDVAGYTQDEVSGYLYNYLSSGEHDLYYLYIGKAGDPIELTINGVLQQADLDKRSWNDYDMDANTIYANLQAQTFYVRYDGSNVGMVAIGLIPEPTTSTLSLLALCALAARRRRK